MQYPTISEYVKASQDAGDNLDMSTEATNAELNEAIIDGWEWGVKYSKDGRKLLKAPYELNGTYSIRKGTKIICDVSFCCCESLSNIVIPDSVTSIGNMAFCRCRSLRDIVIPEGVTSIRNGTFWGCISLKEVAIPNSITSIGDWVFTGCSSLRSVVIPDGVTSIGNGAFWGCSSFLIKYISIPKSVVCLNGNPFAKWDGKLECLSPNFIYEDDVLFNKDKSKIISFRNQAIRSYIIPSSVTSIGDDAFAGCTSLSSVVIPDGVTSIGDRAFEGCTALTSIVIPDSVTSIGDRAFYGCTSLSSVVIPDGVTSIEEFTFYGCTSLSSVVIPDGVTSIGVSAFDGCTSLRSVVIPDGVTSIEEFTFCGCNFPYKLKLELASRFGTGIFGRFFFIP